MNIQHPPPNLGRSPSLPMATARHKEGSLHGTLPHRAPVLLLRPALGPRSNTCTYTTPNSARALRNPAGGYTHTWLNICDFSLPLPFPTSPNAQQAVEFAKPILRSHLWALLYNITVNGCLVDHQQPNTHNTQPVHPRNRAKRVRGGMGVNSPSMKTHRPTQGLGWCIETRVCTPAFLLCTRR